MPSRGIVSNSLPRMVKIWMGARAKDDLASGFVSFSVGKATELIYKKLEGLEKKDPKSTARKIWVNLKEEDQKLYADANAREAWKCLPEDEKKIYQRFPLNDLTNEKIIERTSKIKELDKIIMEAERARGNYVSDSRGVEAKERLQRLGDDATEEQKTELEEIVKNSEFLKKEKLRKAALTMDYILEFFGEMKYWDVSRVTNMSDLFNGIKNFSEDIAIWDVRNVEKMSGIFSGVMDVRKIEDLPEEGKAVAKG